MQCSRGCLYIMTLERVNLVEDPAHPPLLGLFFDVARTGEFNA